MNEFTPSDDPSTRTSAALRLPNACRRSSRGEPATVTVLGPLRTGVTAPPKGCELDSDGRLPICPLQDRPGTTPDLVELGRRKLPRRNRTGSAAEVFVVDDVLNEIQGLVEPTHQRASGRSCRERVDERGVPFRGSGVVDQPPHEPLLAGHLRRHLVPDVTQDRMLALNKVRAQMSRRPACTKRRRVGIRGPEVDREGVAFPFDPCHVAPHTSQSVGVSGTTAWYGFNLSSANAAVPRLCCTT